MNAIAPAPAADARDWEALWAPYDDATYAAACAHLHPEDVVLDIGAGDLRFARRAAGRVRHVYALERNSGVLAAGLAQGALPGNLTVVSGDALAIPVPADVTAGVLLMRHCQHLRQYLARLRDAGCRALVTNARWGMGVECIPLGPLPSFAEARNGWYACLCGAVGFKAARPEDIDGTALAAQTSVADCPACTALPPIWSLP